MIQIFYSGPRRGLHQLAEELMRIGAATEFESPSERRGIGHEIVQVALRVETDVEAGLIGAAAVAGVQRVVRHFKQDHPSANVKVELTPDKPDRSP